MNRFIPFAAMLLSVSVAHPANMLDLRTGVISKGASREIPTRTVEHTEDGIIVSYKFYYANIDDDRIFPGHVHWDIPGFSVSTTPGSPELPGRTDSFVVPDESEPTVTLVSASYKEFSYKIAPARFPLFDNDTTTHDSYNVIPVTPYSGLMPETPCEQMATGTYRTQPVAKIRVSPVLYDYDNGSVRAYSELVYKISYNGTDRASSVYHEPGSLLNPNCQINPDNDGSISTYSLAYNQCVSADAGYLIISVPEFQESLAPFVKWKKQLGYNVTELYDENWTPEKIKESVQEQFWMNTSLMYMLIVGDHSKVPAEVKTYQRPGYRPKNVITDFHYGCLEGDNDFIPDLYRGRWPVRTSSELQSVIAKTIKYEKSPVADPEFYKKAMHFGYFQDEFHWDKTTDPTDPKEEGGSDGEEDRRFVKTCEDVRNHIENATDISVDRLYTAYAHVESRPVRWSTKYSVGDSIPKDFAPDYSIWWNGPENIKNAINDGRLYALYRGHGMPDEWCVGWPDENGIERKGSFGALQITSLTNNDKLPLVFSITCQTGNHESDNCFSRNFLSHKNGGAIGVFAQTNDGYSGVNDKLTSLFFNALWPEPRLNFDLYYNTYYLDDYASSGGSLPLHRLGEMLDFSINGLNANNLNDSSEDLYTRRITHCFADPSLSFNTELPTKISGININRTVSEVNVTLEESAYIAFCDSTNNYSCRFYGTEAVYYTDNTHAVDVTVYNHNKIPTIVCGDPESQPYIPAGSRLIGYKNSHMGGRIDVDFIISSSDRNKRISLVIVDIWSGAILSQAPVDMSLLDEKQTVNMYCPNGVVVASLMIDGYPVSNMELTISKF